MNKTPVLLLLLKALEGRGAESMVTTLARVFVNLGFETHVLCLEKTKDMRLDSQVHYHIVPCDDPELLSKADQSQAYKEVAKRIDSYVIDNIGSPDLILVNIYKLNWIMAYSELPNIINVLHTALSEQFKDWLERDRAECVTHLTQVYAAKPCVCVSEGARQDLLELIGNTKTTTIYNPCDIEEITKAARNSQNDCEKFGLKQKGFILHVGSFAPMKNHRDLLMAYSQSSKKLPLVLVGKGQLEAEIKRLAIDLNIANQVHFLGYQSNPYPLIASAALLVLSSTFEGFGYVIAEAQALNTPVISTDCPFGPRELLPPKNLVAVGDVDQLAELLDKVVNEPNAYQSPFNLDFLPKAVACQYLNFAKICFHTATIAEASDQLNKQLAAVEQ